MSNQDVTHGCKKNSEADFSFSKRVYPDSSVRFLSKNLFRRTLKNGENSGRSWLVYYPSKGSVFCVPCLLFDRNSSSNCTNWFTDWKHSTQRVNDHENSQNHKNNLLKLKDRSHTKTRIDKALMSQIDEEINYWRTVLRRVVSVTKALPSRGLPFKGSDEKFGSVNNRNFLMFLEVVAEYDPFLAYHIWKFGNKRSGSISYLSKSTCEEFISLMAKKVISVIIEEMKTAKYFSIVVDSTPDISYVDQLSFIFRYVKKYGVTVERFLKFMENTGHKAKELADAVFGTLNDLGLDIADCRGQSHDNARNMSGEYSGLHW